MDSLLFQVVSALVAILVFVVWVRPQTFKVLLDKENNDYPSLGRQGQYTAMISSTWVLVAVTLAKKGDVQEYLFIGYMMAWAGAQFGSLWLKMKGQSPGTTTTFEKSKETTRTNEPAKPKETP